ncbi:hypothetical protein 8014-B2_0032 [Lactobacillus phage ATCC 8014-B2]|uniref:Uncharacterized protein n=1 Tax=Lactobacillus phage ATCC 8014-B2 TaxID=1225795 RepID=K4ID44_9CAUD|nr:hypothetical protein HOQ89_gp114 [Lactobacillus phage ATCC 8014-B2]AFU63099.1 hypothetical protein 8014-B2_0032 [Lactobacillus phage ATCC 8014-B2]
MNCLLKSFKRLCTLTRLWTVTKTTVRPAEPQTFQETLDEINRLEKTLISQNQDTFNNLEETNYFDLLETLSVDDDGGGSGSDDKVEPLGYWLENNIADK